VTIHNFKDNLKFYFSFCFVCKVSHIRVTNHFLCHEIDYLRISLLFLLIIAQVLLSVQYIAIILHTIDFVDGKHNSVLLIHGFICMYFCFVCLSLQNIAGVHGVKVLF
jgi:hypothetical protein